MKVASQYRSLCTTRRVQDQGLVIDIQGEGKALDLYLASLKYDGQGKSHLGSMRIIS